MDPDGPGHTPERTFWTFWNYITDIVGRFFSPEPPATEINDTNTTNSADDDVLDSCHKNDNFSSPTEGDEELFIPESSVGSSRPVVFWNSGSERQCEMRQKAVEEDDKLKEKDDGVQEEEIETGTNVCVDLSITTTTGNHNQSSDMTMNVEELMPKILDNNLEESVTMDKPQNKDQMNKDDEKNTDLAEKTERKLQSDIAFLEKPDHAEADDTQVSASITFENSDNKSAMKGVKEMEIESNNNLVFVLEEDEKHVKQKLTASNRSDESANGKSENPENKFKKVQSKILEKNRKSTLDTEDGEKTKEACLALVKDQDMTLQAINKFEIVHGEYGSGELKDTNEGNLNKTHTSLVLETEPLSALNNETFQNECRKEQGNDEVAASSSRQEEPTAKDTLEEESTTNNNDFIRQDLTYKMEDGEQLDATNSALKTPTSNENDMGNCCVEIKSKSGSTQEQGMACKNIPPSEFEGKERPCSYKESREEVPGYNNGSAAQRFLEGGNCWENQSSVLREEEERKSGAVKSVQNEGKEKFEDLMETELIRSRSEEQNARPEEPLPDMKTTSEYTKIETYIFSEEDEEEGEELKEEAREIEVKMRDVDGVVDDVEIQDSQTTFQNCILLAQSTFQNESNMEMMERSFVEAQAPGMDHVLDTDDRSLTIEKVPKVKTISEKLKLQSTEEYSAAASHDDVLPDVVHHEISVEDECQSCLLEQMICGDVIQDEILDLWIQQTSINSSKVRKEEQGCENSPFDLQEEEEVESIPELNMACAVNKSTTRSGFFEQSLHRGASVECNKQELPKEEQIMNSRCTLNKSDEQNGFSLAKLELEMLWDEDLFKSSSTTLERTDDGESIPSQNIDLLGSMSSPKMQNDSTFSIEMDNEPFTTEPEDQCDSLKEIKNIFHMTVTSTDEKSKVEALQEFDGEEDIDKINVSKLDFTPQKSRIAVKNPSIRPPKHLRSLLLKPSLEPSPAKHLELHVPAGVPLGIAVKLPGLGSGFPILKKTKKTVEEETETTAQETKTVEEEHQLKQEDSQQRPKWMPPSHPGFGNPFMSELKSKLKKNKKE